MHSALQATAGTVRHARKSMLQPRQTMRNSLQGKRGARPTGLPARRVLTKASSSDVDLDKVLIVLAQKWEGAENKPVVIGYSAAAVFLFFFSEWFIHLPVVDLLVGFPIQLLGLLTLPYVGVRWIVGKQDWFADVSSATDTVVDALPGLKKVE